MVMIDCKKFGGQGEHFLGFFQYLKVHGFDFICIFYVKSLNIDHQREKIVHRKPKFHLEGFSQLFHL